jgi:regulator of sigma D
MVKENKERLFKLGCLMDGTETIVSAESDFTKNKYGLFTVESGKPDKTDLRLIKKAFQDCSGSALKLINHVKKTGKFHGSLVGLLSAPARKIYDESTAQAQKIYYETTAPARKIYDESTAQARKIYDESTAQAQKIYYETTAPAQKIYDESTAQAQKIYDESTAQAQKIYDESTAPAQKIYDESTAQAQKIYDETTAQAWVKLFKVKKNRLF